MSTFAAVKLKRLAIVTGSLVLFLSVSSLKSMQLQKSLSFSFKQDKSHQKKQEVAASILKDDIKESSTNTTRLKANSQFVGEKITSIFVRNNDSKQIKLSMLVSHKDELTNSVRELVKKHVTPLVFSVSVLPNRSTVFEPKLLRFSQNGKTWIPKIQGSKTDVILLEEDGKFGGAIADGDIHQGMVLLPAWFSPTSLISVHYGDFHYLAQFIGADTSNKTSPSLISSSPTTKPEIISQPPNLKRALGSIYFR